MIFTGSNVEFNVISCVNPLMQANMMNNMGKNMQMNQMIMNNMGNNMQMNQMMMNNNMNMMMNK